MYVLQVPWCGLPWRGTGRCRGGGCRGGGQVDAAREKLCVLNAAMLTEVALLAYLSPF